MESSIMKNMVIIKNLPSNIVDEAIVILKPNQKVKNLEFIETSKKSNGENNKKSNKEYILKEAEIILSDCVKVLENKREKTSDNKMIIKKYKKLSIYSVCISILLCISLIANLV